MVILFLCISLWIFAFCRFFISLCFSNIFASVIFFCFMFVLQFFWWSMNWLFIFFLYCNPYFVDAIFLEIIGLKWRVSKHARVLKTKNRSFFFSADLFEFLLFVDSSSHCASLTSSHMLFFLFMCVLDLFCHQSTDFSCSSYILTQICLMLFFRTSRL